MRRGTEGHITHLDQWYGDFVEPDWRCVERSCGTGQLPDRPGCISGRPILGARPIPALTHQQVQVRFAY